ncbi:MAG TPA: ABC transporter permease subunit [Clostridiales bacterium]|nr:ABC transporter permease subunit [Clostridiales bacterium]
MYFRKFIKKFRKQSAYHLMLFPGFLAALVFSYVPMFGIIIAFKDFSLRRGVFASKWVGFSNFKHFFTDMGLMPAIINTVAIGFLSIVLAFPAAIIFALLLNELKSRKFKRLIQTVSYFPHFISWVVISVIMITFLSPSEGIVNHIIVSLGISDNPILFIGKPEYFWWIAVLSVIWKETGWKAIIYIAAISGIDQTIYEASLIDGAGRFKRIWYITLPSISGTISILLILSISSIPFVAFDQSYLLGNTLNYERSIVLSHYVYKLGIINGNYSYSSAVGLILSVVSAAFMIAANYISKKTKGTGVV